MWKEGRPIERREREEREKYDKDRCERNQTTTSLASLHILLSTSPSPLPWVLCQASKNHSNQEQATASGSYHTRERRGRPGRKVSTRSKSHLPFLDHFGSFTYLRVDFGVCELFARSPFLACFPATACLGFPARSALVVLLILDEP